jgi:5-phospho-D-xylono-1,4-lactonase
MMVSSPPPIESSPVMTVLGPIDHSELGITDSHNHVWIDFVEGSDTGGPVLNQYTPILRELVEYREKGGKSLLDCQPGGCGRDGNRLQTLSRESGINLIACTGFHRKKYYPQNYKLWELSSQGVCDFLWSEINQGLTETINSNEPVKAGFIKIALESTWAECPQTAIEGAAYAAKRGKTLVEIHTEKGALAEKACEYFMEMGLSPQQIVLCHMDKRPDFGLHKELAQLGVLLEYDTFFRSKYNPTNNLWPLIVQMVNAGLSDRVALATDMAESEYYHNLGGGAGLASFPGEICNQLFKRRVPKTTRLKLLGGNIARRLAAIN